MASIERKPLPTKSLAPIHNDQDQSEVNPTKRLANGRTPLLTIQPTLPRDPKDTKRLLAAERQRASRSRKRLAAVKNSKDEQNKVDPNQSPDCEEADGVVLKSGKYCCNICGGKMKNVKKLIKCHNSKMHPQDPVKGSAYLRRMAHNPTPCTKCDKICINIEMRNKHLIRDHPEA
ncbi:hypothetical protein F4824DRAFT_517443 [Ustulina deusta]|nr:hypothetical protein F4824DRAFT_517443 [Ustulina deusta]